MIILIVLLFIILFCLSKSLIKDSISSLFAWSFLLYWGITLIISYFNPYELYRVSDYAYFLLLINVLFFMIGFLLVKKKTYKKIPDINVESIVRTKIFKILLLIGIILAWSLFMTKRVMLSYIDDNVALFRKDFFEILFEGRPLLLYGYYLFLFPLYYFLVSLFCYSIFFYRKKWVLIGSLLYLMPFMSLSEGRLAYMCLAMVLFFDLILYRNQNRGYSIPISMKIFTVIGFMSLYFFMAYTTSRRAGQESIWEGADELNKTVVVYSISPLRAFDYAIHHNYIEKAGGYKWGLASICGFEYVVNSALKRIGIDYESVRTVTNSELQNNVVPVSNGAEINYSYTNAIYHYYDFGVIGIFIIPLLFGYFCRNMIIRFNNEGSFYMHALCTFLFFILLHTVFSWYFNKLFTIPYMLFLIYKNRKMH